MSFRIGHSHDTHKLVEGRPLIIGGVKIDYPLGLLGHSDADVLYHAVSESIIGALALGDIGSHFSDNDPKYKGMNSSYFIIETKKKLEQKNYRITNLDITIYIEKPMMRDYIPIMKDNLKNLLELDLDQINIKATRGEGLGFIGRGEGVSSDCIVLIESKEIIKKLNI